MSTTLCAHVYVLTIYETHNCWYELNVSWYTKAECLGYKVFQGGTTSPPLSFLLCTRGLCSCSLNASCALLDCNVAPLCAFAAVKAVSRHASMDPNSCCALRQ